MHRLLFTLNQLWWLNNDGVIVMRRWLLFNLNIYKVKVMVIWWRSIQIRTSRYAEHWRQIIICLITLAVCRFAEKRTTKTHIYRETLLSDWFRKQFLYKRSNLARCEFCWESAVCGGSVGELADAAVQQKYYSWKLYKIHMNLRMRK